MKCSLHSTHRQPQKKSKQNFENGIKERAQEEDRPVAGCSQSRTELFSCRAFLRLLGRVSRCCRFLSFALSLSSVSFLRSDWNDGKATKFNGRETLLLPCLGSRARKGVGNGEGQGTERNSPSRGELMRRGPCVGWLVRGRRNGNIWTTRLLKERGISKDGAFWGWIWWWVGGWL